MIKLVDLLKEINEGKQVGNLYHFTPIKKIIPILDSQILLPNSENQISTTRRPNMDVSGFMKMQMGRSNIIRLTLDGDKISTKYKIRPYVYFDNEEYPEGEDLGEEQIIVNGENFPFLPYLKRIDIFINSEKSYQKEEKIINEVINLLDKMNIPYNIYKGKPSSNIPYEQSKEGDPKNIKYIPLNNLPDDSIISNDITLNNISHIPENLTVNANLNILDSKKIKLPTKLTVKNNLWILRCGITSLPEKLEVGELQITNTPITSLPKNLIFSSPKKSKLSFSKTNLLSLPDNLTVNTLLINTSPINSIPNNLNVNFLGINNTPLNKKYTKEELKKIIEDKGGKVNRIEDNFWII